MSEKISMVKSGCMVMILPGALLFLSIFLTGLQPIRSPDFWHHAASGRLVAKSGPQRSEVFSHTAQGERWVQFEWLSQLFIYLGYMNLGGAGMIVAKALIISCGFMLIWRAGLSRAGPVTAGFTALSSAIALIDRSFVRPEMFAWLMFGAFVIALDIARHRSPKFAWLLPLIIIPWVNMHGSYPAGLALLGIVCAGETIKLWRKKRSEPDAKARLKTFWLALASCVLATFVNPYGPIMWHVPLFLIRSPEIGEYIAEWRASTYEAFLNLHFLGVWICVLVFLLTIRRVDLTDLLIVGAFGFLAWRAQRNIPLLAFVCAPIFARHIHLFIKQAGLIRRFSRQTTRHIIAGFMPVLTLAALGAPGFESLSLKILWYANYPREAADFLDEKEIRGNLFNTYHLGNYLLWRLYPDNLVFIDGRVDMYGEAIMREYRSLFKAEDGWAEKLTEYNIRAAVIAMPHGDQRADPLVDRLHQSEEWRLAYWDDVAFIYLPKSAIDERPEFFRQFRLRPDLFEPQSAAPDIIQIALDEFYAIIEMNPDCVMAHSRLGELLERIGRNHEALNHLRTVVFLRPRSGVAHYNLGNLLARMGELDEAENHLLASQRFDGPDISTLRTLGNLNFQRKDYASAGSYFRRILRAEPNDWRARRSLAAAYENMGRINDAKRELRIILEQRPDNEEVRRKLRELEQKPGD